MAIHYARTFLPWILLAVVSGFDAQAGAGAGLAAAIALLVLDRRAGTPWSGLVLESATTVFMALLTALALAVPDSPALGYGASLAIGWLALAAWGTLAVRRPFTAGIARRRVSEEIAATELFQRVNRVLTLVWAVSFSVTAAVLGCVQALAPHDTPLLIACKIAGFAVPVVFTARYPDAARKRHPAKPDAQPSPR